MSEFVMNCFSFSFRFCFRFLKTTNKSQRVWVSQK